MLPLTLKWRGAHRVINRFDFQLAQDRGLLFWQTPSNAAILNKSMTDDWWVDVVTRNLDDTKKRRLNHGKYFESSNE